MGQGNKIARLEKNDTPDNQGFLERISSGAISQNQEISGLLSRSIFNIAMLTFREPCQCRFTGLVARNISSHSQSGQTKDLQE
jgi:hypothetical protein